MAKRKQADQPSLDSYFSGSVPKKLKATKVKTKAGPSKPPEVIELSDSDDNSPPVASSSRISPPPSPKKVIRLGAATTSVQRKEPPYSTLTHDIPAFVPIPDDYHLTSGSVAFSFLAYTLAEISKTRSRIAILNGLTNCFRVIAIHHPPSLTPAIYLLSNTLSPPYAQVELGLGPSAITQSIQQVSGLTAANLRKLYNKHGDPGDVAYAAKVNTRTLIPLPPLTISGVYEALLKISNCKGQGAAKQRQHIVEKLLVAAKGEETRFLVRILSQNLRIGAVRTSLLTALARATVLTPLPEKLSSKWYASAALLKTVQKGDESAQEKLKNKFKRAEDLLRRMFALQPNYEYIVTALGEGGFEHLSENGGLAVGIPLLPTLGTPARSLEEVYERFGELPFTAECKYDGQRAQIHIQRTGAGIEVKIFSRHLEDMTDKYPDVVATMMQMSTDKGVDSAIVDAEIVAVSPDTGELRSFQDLSGRARKAVNIGDITIPVCVFAFDLMYLNDKVLLEEDFRVRRALIRQHLPPITSPVRGSAAFAHVEACDSTEGLAEVQSFWNRAVQGQSEGLMVKLLDSGNASAEPDRGDIAIPTTAKSSKKLSAHYNIDQRTYSWIKLKKDYVEGIGDSLDLIPIGAWNGNGRKAGWWSPILLGLWDPSTGKPVAVCKCMSGFSDAFYKDLTARYSLNDEDNCSARPFWDGDFGGFRPSVYFRPHEVWELRGADITVSPVSTASQGLFGGVSGEKGLSIRFPRFIKLREDKGIEEASSPTQLANMYQNQPSMRAQGKTAGADDGDLEDPDPESENVTEDEL
ncbi:ATP-dependent DNA ligase [Cylindrobasidium torrendii FP15055 ss-10]|uniref:DNA ligase n=1 Tax=Cylindrobasidium torrendii FP15055 ss-10 TaxID=1314674 RepID=A0A0D7BV50_9AGAR|nr:ATP-dependent DNA ligase [Cylindrobasidium torrendii FP15055 ss-10]